jgi:magnesium-transporting ATPase (P-type)
MDRPPRSRDDRVLTSSLLARAYLFLGGFEAAAGMAAFFSVLPRSGYAAATTACLGAIVVTQVVNVHLCRSDHESALTSLGQSNPLIAAGIATEIVLILLIAYTPVGNALFGTAPLDARTWLVMLPFAAAMLAAEEGRKWIVRRQSRPLPTDTARPPG